MSNKRKVILLVAVALLGFALLITTSFLADRAIIGTISAVVLVLFSMIIVLGALFCVSKIDYETGVYKCKKCGHIFKPTFKEYICSAHIHTTRYFKCPECKEKSWCRCRRKG